jgi:hypothetical protein
MSSTRAGRASTAVGTALVLLGVVGLVTLFVVQPFAGCTEVGVPPGADTGLELRGIEDGSFVYSPDGVNECSTPLGVAATPPAGVVVGAGLLAYGRFGRG